MTDTMIKVAMFLGDNGEAELSRAMFAEIGRDFAKARAETLAAVRKKLELLRAYHESSTDIHQAAGENLEATDSERAEHGFKRALKALDDFQPAASDLEALLREAQQPLLDVLRDAPRPANISSPQGQILELDNAMFHRAYFDWYRKRIVELEKARAIEGKG